MREINAIQPRISVVLATYNGSAYLSQLMDSLCRQTLLPYEIVICDDGSHDNTIEILNTYKDLLPLRIYSNDKSLGVVKNFQKGVTLCSGDYIAFCDQDDIWLPQKLAKSIREIEKIDGPLPVIVFTDLTVVDQHLNIIADSYWKHRQLSPQHETFASLIYGNVVTGCTMVINRAMAIEVARMPSNVLMHDFWIACVAYGIGRYTFIKESTILYRQHTTNVTNNDAITWCTRFKKFLLFLNASHEINDYLIPEIFQARMFANLYNDRLASSDIDSLNRLFALAPKHPFYRKWKMFLIKYLHIISL